MYGLFSNIDRFLFQICFQFFPHDFAFDKAVVEEEYQYENEYSEYDDRNSNVNDNKNPGTQSFLGFSQPALSR